MQSEAINQGALSVVLFSDPIGNIWTKSKLSITKGCLGDKPRFATMTFVTVVLRFDPIGNIWQTYLF